MLTSKKVLLLIFCSLSAIAQGQTQNIYYDMQLYGHSETAPISQIVLDEFEGPSFDGGDTSFTFNRWEIGGVYRGLKLAAIARYDYYLNYSRDVAALVYAESNDLPVETNRRYDLYLDAFHARTQGLKLGYEFTNMSNMSVAFDLSLLRVGSFIDGDIKGGVTVFDDDYQGEINLDYVYDKDKLLDRVNDKPEGNGYSLDLAWSWQPNDDHTFAAQWLDVLSEITIDRAPFTQAVASSDRISLNPDGLIDVKPVLSGREGFREHRLRFKSRLILSNRYQLKSDWLLNSNIMRFDGELYPSVGLDHNWSESHSSGLAFDLHTKAFTVSYASSFVEVSLTSDRFDVEKAYTFGIAFSSMFRF